MSLHERANEAARLLSAMVARASDQQLLHAQEVLLEAAAHSAELREAIEAAKPVPVAELIDDLDW
jgi:hypothetical protein